MHKSLVVSAACTGNLYGLILMLQNIVEMIPVVFPLLSLGGKPADLN